MTKELQLYGSVPGAALPVRWFLSSALSLLPVLHAVLAIRKIPFWHSIESRVSLLWVEDDSGWDFFEFRPPNV